MTEPKQISVADYDLFEAVCLCHAAMAKDSPEPASFYLPQILNLLFGYLSSQQREELENYLAQKLYLPTVKLHFAK